MVKLKFFLPRKFYHYVVSFREAEFNYKFSKKYLSFIPHHVGVVLDSFYFEMDLDGIDKFKAYKLDGIKTIDVEISDDFKSRDHKMIFKNYIRDLYKRKVKYDYKGLLHYVFPFIKQDKNRKYCSEMIADGLRLAQYDIYKTKITPYKLLKIILYKKYKDEVSFKDLDVKWYISFLDLDS